MTNQQQKSFENRNKIYQERDTVASHSYTLHYVNPKTNIVAYSDIDALQTLFKGNITFSRSASGMRTTCYLHIFGHSIVKTQVSGCGYDTHTHTLIEALAKLKEQEKNAEDYNGSLSFINLMQSAVNVGDMFQNSLRRAGILAAHIGG